MHPCPCYTAWLCNVPLKGLHSEGIVVDHRSNWTMRGLL